MSTHSFIWNNLCVPGKWGGPRVAEAGTADWVMCLLQGPSWERGRADGTRRGLAGLALCLFTFVCILPFVVVYHLTLG